jgi:hypothetical protein
MQSVQDPTTGEMIPTPQPSVAIRVRYSAGSSTLTARTEESGPTRSVRVAHDYGLPMATNAALAAQAWIDRHCNYEAQLLPHSFVYGPDRFFSFRITGGKKTS